MWTSLMLVNINIAEMPLRCNYKGEEDPVDRWLLNKKWANAGGSIELYWVLCQLLKEH